MNNYPYLGEGDLPRLGMVEIENVYNTSCANVND